MLEQVASSKSSLLLKIILQNTQTLHLFTNDSSIKKSFIEQVASSKYVFIAEDYFTKHINITAIYQ